MMSLVDEATSRTTNVDDLNVNEGDGTTDAFLQAETGTVYKTREDAVKGITEKDRYIAELKAKLEAKQSQDEMLSRITESMQRGIGQPKPEVDAKAILSQYAKRIDDEGGVAIVELMDEYLTRKEQQESQRFSAELKKRDDELRSLREQMMDFDPRYQSRKEQVDEVQAKYSVPREVAVQIVNDLMKQAEHPDRPQLPGTTDSIRAGRSASVGLSADDRAMLAKALGRPLTKDEEKALLEREALKRKGRM